MKYNLKTGRSHYGFKDKVPDFKNKQVQKEFEVINPDLYTTHLHGIQNKARRFFSLPWRGLLILRIIGNHIKNGDLTLKDINILLTLRDLNNE